MDRARPIGVSILSILVVATATLLAATDPKPGVDWPSYRGIGASGIAEGYPTVTSWNTETNTNVRWKTPVAGLSHSSPVVWGDQVCVTTAVNGEAKPLLKVGLYGDIKPVEDSSVHQWKVLCYDAATGKPRWEQTAHQGVPKVKRHTKATQANTTLATDGEHLVALFGAEGMYVYDMKGKLLWKKDLGRLDAGFFRAPEAQWGYASSPIIHAGRIIVQADVQKDSFLAAFDVKTGRELWRTPRADVPTFGTPAIYMSNGRAQIVVNGWKHIGGYDFETGKEVWKLVGGGDIPVPTPVVAHNLILSPTPTEESHRYTRSDQPRRATSRRPGTPRTTTTWRGARRAKGPTCRRRSSTAITSTCARTTACSPCSTRARGRRPISSGLAMARPGSARQLSRPTGSSITAARTGTCMCSKRGRRSSN